MLDAKYVKERAKLLGADEVGIAPIERFAGAPIQMDPKQIMPQTRSVIVMVFRVLRGSLRGVEEGTFFSNYSSMGYGGITYVYMPIVVVNLCRLLEDEGYEAVPMGHQSDWRAIDNEGALRPGYSLPVEAGKAAPDVMIQLRIAAYLAGLGEIGYSKLFLSPRFGPRCRLGVVLTEAALEPDSIYDGPRLCDRCMACVADCPGQAISSTETVRVELGGRIVEWGQLNCPSCDIAFRGGRPLDNGEKGYYTERMYGKEIEASDVSPFAKKPRNLYNTGQAVCGGKGCVRACMIHLEQRGVLQNKFKNKFRQKKLWKFDWSTKEAIKLREIAKKTKHTSLSNISAADCE